MCIRNRGGAVKEAERTWGLLFNYLGGETEEGHDKEAHHIRHVAEVFSAPRFTARARVHGLREGRAFDIELGDNLLTFTKYKGINPEIGGDIRSLGIDNADYRYPVSRLLSLGVNAEF